MPGRRLIVVSEREHAYLDVDALPAVKVGRAPDNDVVLKDDMVSRRHCVLERVPGSDEAWRVRDLKSFNGTYLNEKRVRDEPLKMWDAVRVGRTKMILVDRMGEASATDKAAVGTADPNDPNAIAEQLAASAEAPPAIPPSSAGPVTEGAEEVGGATRVMQADGTDMAEVLQNKEIRAVIDDLLRREREKAEREVSRRVRDESAPAVLPPAEALAVRARRFGPLDGGGDFYDVFPGGGQEETCVAVGSVSGVGVAACIAASAARHALRGLVAGRPADAAPLELVQELRELLQETLHPGSAVSILLCRVAGGKARIGAVGGTGAVLYDSAKDAVEILRAPGRRDEEAIRPQAVEHLLKDGDRLVLLSDGGGSLRKQGGNETHGVERLQQALMSSKALAAKELSQKLADAFESFCGGNPDRDATAVVVATR